MEAPPSVKKYLVPMASKTLDVLECFRSPNEELTLDDVTARTGISHTTAFRILLTLAHRQYLIRQGTRYRVSRVQRKVKLGFCATLNLPFARAVAQSLQQAGQQAGLDLVVRDNQQSREVALDNARALAEENVDVAIEFQRHQDFAPLIAEIFASAKIPFIAVHVPHAGAIYFGPDNYRAGVSAGRLLGEYAAARYAGRPRALVLLEIQEAGTPLSARMTGVIDGARQVLASLPDGKIVHLDGSGDREKSRRVTAALLREMRNPAKVLLAAGSDYSALGAMDALADLDLSGKCAIVGHDGDVEALKQVANAESPLIGTVAFFPERYGPGLVNLILRMLRGEQILPYHHVNHEVITKAGAQVAQSGRHK